ncbi:hypothetical protein CTI12_AA029660 [Artemisia annua]|uniref:Uncharacterized protein n=1 Tax=Artemisia annua TaxID=35608 RepID=A0A2U1QDE4_ARTAN|nr:hypothetical protein CTI12_AA029660 [Artemisia annua]
MEEACYDQSPPTQDSYHEDEVIDTLSLSDLMIYDNNGDPHDFYQLDEQNLDDDEEFEFSSEFLKTSMSNNVIFCGKLIPYKESIVSPSNHKLESKKQHKKRWWISRFLKKSSRSKSNNDSEKLDLRYEQVPIRRVSILASATKPRWYFLLFGFGSNSFPAHMHIRDLKKRQTSVGNKDSRDNKISSTSAEKLDLRYEQVPIRRVSILASATKPRWYFLLFGFGSNSFPAHMHIRDLKKRQTSVGNKDSRDNKISSTSAGNTGSWRLMRLR